MEHGAWSLEPGAWGHGAWALDGSKVEANASKHMAMSHEQMLRAEKQLAQEINALMRKAETLDAQEDRRSGNTNRGSDLPDELRRRQDRLDRIRQARREWKRRRPLPQRANARKKLIRPKSRLMPPRRRMHQRLSRQN
jgi:hypothetical protein